MSHSGKKNHYHGPGPEFRRRQYRLLRLFLVFVALAALSGLCLRAYRFLLASPLLQVSTIQVSGCHHLHPQQVIQQAAIRPGVNILSLDLKAISHRLANHPWVASAVVSREIPDRIRIEIEERRPVALVRGQHFYLVDLQGVCFSRALPGSYPSLPIISGLESERLRPGRRLPRELGRLLESLHRQCQGQLPWRLISEIRWHKDRGLTLFTVRGGIEIDLGRSNFHVRIARLKKVLSFLESKGIQSRLQRIDLTYGDRAYVRGNFPNFRHNRLQQRGV